MTGPPRRTPSRRSSRSWPARRSREMGQELRSIRQRLQEQSLRDATDRKRMVEGYSGIAAIGQMTAGMLPVIPHELRRIRDELERMKAVLAHRRIPEVRESMTGLDASLAEHRRDAPRHLRRHRRGRAEAGHRPRGGGQVVPAARRPAPRRARRRDGTRHPGKRRAPERDAAGEFLLPAPDPHLELARLDEGDGIAPDQADRARDGRPLRAGLLRQRARAFRSSWRRRSSIPCSAARKAAGGWG